MVWLILAVALWGIVHSWLASHTFKRWLMRVLGDGFKKFYRLLYNLFSVISIVPVLYLMLTLPDQDFYHVPAPWRYLMFAGQGLSAILLLVSLLQTDILSFAGLQQIVAAEKPGKLVVNGVYRWVRHPLYTFMLAFAWLSPSVSVNLFVVYVAFTLYILVGIYFEERKLLREFGQAYADYKAVTPMLIPGLRFNGNK